jgi:hypothetical protein
VQEARGAGLRLGQCAQDAGRGFRGCTVNVESGRNEIANLPNSVNLPQTG